MKAKEIRERSDAEIAELEQQVKKALFAARMKNFTGQLTDTSQLGKARKTLARIQQVRTQRAAEAAGSQS